MKQYGLIINDADNPLTSIALNVMDSVDDPRVRGLLPSFRFDIPANAVVIAEWESEELNASIKDVIALENPSEDQLRKTFLDVINGSQITPGNGSTGNGNLFGFGNGLFDLPSFAWLGLALYSGYKGTTGSNKWFAITALATNNYIKSKKS